METEITNVEDLIVEEEDINTWNIAICPLCGQEFDLTRVRSIGEYIICPHCNRTY